MNRPWKFFSLGKPEQGFNFCWRQNKSGWNLASYSHCCHIYFLIHISSNLKILKCPELERGKLRCTYSLTEQDMDPLRLWYLWSDGPGPSTADLGGSRGLWPHGWRQCALLSIRCIIWGIVFIAWFKTCTLHGLTFFSSSIVSGFISTRGPVKLNPALSLHDSNQVTMSHGTFWMPRALTDALGQQWDLDCLELLNKALTFLAHF